MKQLSRSLSVLLLVFLSAACDEQFDPTAVYPGSLAIQVLAGDSQHGVPRSWLPTSLQVRVVHANTQEPAAGVSVTWRAVSGSDVELETNASVTNASGIATTRMRLGSNNGVYVIEAAFAGLRREPARFVAISGSN